MGEVSANPLQAKRRFSSKTKWVLLLFVVVTAIVLCVFLCIVFPKLQIRGTFVSVNEGNLEYIQFNDSRFRYENSYNSSFGTYSVKGNRIILTFDDGTIKNYTRKKDLILNESCFVLQSTQQSNMRIYEQSDHYDFEDGSYFYTDQVLCLDEAGSYSQTTNVLCNLFSNETETTGSYTIRSSWLNLIEDTTGETAQLYILDDQLYDKIFRKQK